MHNFLESYFFINSFDPYLIKSQDKNTVIIFRNYEKKINTKQIIDIRNLCKKNNLKFLLANNFKLALKLNLDGVYIPSFNKTYDHLSYSYKKNFFLIGSAHNLKEIKNKEKQKVNRIVLSSIFKKNNNHLGLIKFQNLVNLSKKNIVALGGINDKNLKKINLTKAIGFAGISFFQKKGPYKGPFNNVIY